MLLYFEMESMKYISICQSFHMKYDSTFHAAEQLRHNLKKSVVFPKLYILATQLITFVFLAYLVRAANFVFFQAGISCYSGNIHGDRQPCIG